MGAGPAFDNLAPDGLPDCLDVLNRAGRWRHLHVAGAVHLRPWSSGVSHAFT